MKNKQFLKRKKTYKGITILSNRSIVSQLQILVQHCAIKINVCYISCLYYK